MGEHERLNKLDREMGAVQVVQKGHGRRLDKMDARQDRLDKNQVKLMLWLTTLSTGGSVAGNALFEFIKGF